MSFSGPQTRIEPLERLLAMAEQVLYGRASRAQLVHALQDIHQAVARARAQARPPGDTWHPVVLAAARAYVAGLHGLEDGLVELMCFANSPGRNRLARATRKILWAADYLGQVRSCLAEAA